MSEVIDADNCMHAPMHGVRRVVPQIDKSVLRMHAQSYVLLELHVLY
jgi:hypothetical protein